MRGSAWIAHLAASVGEAQLDAPETGRERALIRNSVVKLVNTARLAGALQNCSDQAPSARSAGRACTS